jgi:hypothetical protein
VLSTDSGAVADDTDNTKEERNSQDGGRWMDSNADGCDAQPGDFPATESEENASNFC